jgi:hypothetical protein
MICFTHASEYLFFLSFVYDLFLPEKDLGSIKLRRPLAPSSSGRKINLFSLPSAALTKLPVPGDHGFGILEKAGKNFNSARAALIFLFIFHLPERERQDNLSTGNIFLFLPGRWNCLSHQYSIFSGKNSSAFVSQNYIDRDGKKSA